MTARTLWDSPRTQLITRIAATGINQQALADLAGVDRRTMVRYITGEYAPTDVVFAALTDVENRARRARTLIGSHLSRGRDIETLLYRTDDHLWEARPWAEPLPLSWWRKCLADALGVGSQPWPQTAPTGDQSS